MQLPNDVYYWCLFVVFAFFKFLSNTFVQGAGRLRSNTYDFPEDQRDRTPILARQELVLRGSRLWGNDLENLVPFLFVSLAAALCAIEIHVYVILLCVFALARVVHAIALARGAQPWRSLCYGAGVIAMIVMVGMTAVRLIEILPTLG